MNKTTKYSCNLAIAGAVINAALNLIKQLQTVDVQLRSEINWKEVLFAAGKGAVAGATIGGIAGAICDYENSLEKPQNTNAFLRSVISRVKLEPKNSSYQKLEQRADQLVEILTQSFGNKFSTPPMRGGSTTDGTALKSKFDIDIFLSFAPTSFRSTRDMYERLFTFLENQVNHYGIREVRDQKKSIDVISTINGEEYKIDIVPKKLSKSNRRTTSGYLFVNNASFWGDASTYTKTDFEKLRSLGLTRVQKEIVLILKHWKNKYDLPLSTHLLKNLVLNAYANNRDRIPKGITSKVIMILEHIVENLDIAKIRSVENTNNILTNLSSERKSVIIEACKDAIEEFKYQPNSILSNFE